MFHFSLFIQETFTHDEIAKSFLNHYLPKSLLKQVDMNTLGIVKDSFIDKELQEHFSDILYTARFLRTLIFSSIFLLSTRAIQSNWFPCRYCDTR
ncbi:MAG: Rpn family recombination-promoting nuclease/putative transposase [Desulfobacterales bacterium]|nr:Rpn family recombination-promoting nuclease/putative transposase [Desulfobacterales bacterium]